MDIQIIFFTNDVQLTQSLCNRGCILAYVSQIPQAHPNFYAE